MTHSVTPSDRAGRADHADGPHPRRRTLLTAGAVTSLAAAVTLSGGGTAHAAGDRATPGDLRGRLRALERKHSARVGVYGHNLATGRKVGYREDRLFPMCSLFKSLAAAAVLRDLDHDGTVLAKRIRYTKDDLLVHSPKTCENLATGMTVEELCDATVRYSDNAAGNLLLRELGGPTAITDFCRDIGDRVTRLDRWETALNSAEPWREEDTTSARAIGRSYGRLILGTALERADRERLTDWMLRNTTSGNRFRAGLPKDWLIADKTGGGSYGTNNNAGIAWTPDGAPLVLAVLTTKPDQPTATPDDPLVRDAAEALGESLV
ncbi:class A beta-lactamase [Streptomyces sp. NPDC000594]|uniref:class A beta-lactamase n=1 Tax=Streptomyces sp. NPDC000594 TaxID=3154261 RepID=UPI00332FE4A1